LSKNRIISLNKNCKVILTEGETNTEFDYEKRGFLAVLAVIFFIFRICKATLHQVYHMRKIIG
jgi:hypothetical protein